MLALRGGHRTGQDIGSRMSAELSLRIGKIDLDYAYAPYGDLGNIHRISLGIKF